MIAAVLVISGLAVGGAALGGGRTHSRLLAPRRKVRLAVQSITVPFPQAGSCTVAGGSSCSLTPCTQLTGQPSTKALMTPADCQLSESGRAEAHGAPSVRISGPSDRSS